MAEITGRLRDDEDDRAPVTDDAFRPQAVFVGTDGADTFDGTADDDTAEGLGADDVLIGQEGDDEFRGGPDNDRLEGGPGNDKLLGGSGADNIMGNADDDVINGGRGGDTLDGGGGNDKIFGLGGFDTIFGKNGDDQLEGAGKADTINGGPGADTILGGLGGDRLDGGGGNDTIDGEGGVDQLFGRGGDDILLGGGKDDTLKGNAGNDLLDGEGGVDVMTGGPGEDTFRFTSKDGNVDRILDFETGVDRLDLSALIDPDDLPQSGDLTGFVDFNVVPEGTIIGIDPTGLSNFQPLVGLEGTQVASLSLEELGLSRTVITEPTIVSALNRTDGNGASFVPSLSEDGRFVTFASSSTYFGVDDNNGFFDIYRVDLQTGEIIRLSETAAGADGNENSFFPDISADGGQIAFDSRANNLPGDPNGSLDQADIFHADAGGDPTFVSIENNRFATSPSISADGTLVAFRAEATGRAETGDPAPEDTIFERIYVRDLSDPGSLVVEVSTSASGEFADAESIFPSMAANGGFVAFDSMATNLAGPDANAGFDIFVKTLGNGIFGAIQVASTDADGNQVDGDHRAPAISADGRFVAFHSDGQFTADDTDATLDVYIKDLQTGEITLVSTSVDGAKGNDESLSAAISDDGRFVAFRSAADNLVAGDTNGVHDIFVKDLETGAIARFEVEGDTSGVSPIQGVVTLRPALSGDGTIVAYSTEVDIGAGGGIAESQVVAAPVIFDAGPATVASAPQSLDTLLVDDTVA